MVHSTAFARREKWIVSNAPDKSNQTGLQTSAWINNVKVTDALTSSVSGELPWNWFKGETINSNTETTLQVVFL